MKYASLKMIALVVATGSLIAACANGNDSPNFDSGGAGGVGAVGAGGVPTSGATTSDASSTVAATSTGSGPMTDAGSSCVPKCNADSDCQNTCPVAQTGINCCDGKTGVCYVASTPICPMPQPDGGTVTPPY